VLLRLVMQLVRWGERTPIDRSECEWSRAVLVSLSLVLAVGVFVPGALSTQSSNFPRPLFGGPRNYATATAAWAVATADLNGDAKPDIVAVDVNSDAVSALINRGRGTFSRARVYRSRVRDGGSWAVAIGDLNGDHRPDLATADPDANTATILINTGDGHFRRSAAYPTGAAPQDVSVADLNGDRSLDLVTANKDASTVSVLLNRGDGTFETRRGYGTGRASKPESVAIADLNDDGKPDLATANFEDTVSIFLNRGDGSFQTRSDLRAGSGPRSVAIADLNRDRRPDVVTANTSTGETVDSVSVFLNKGSGLFRRQLDYRKAGLELGFGSVAIGDLNGDGRPDVATGNDTDPGTDSILINRGDGRFQPRFDYVTGRGEEASGARTIAIADLNGDGTPELVTARDTTKSVSVLINALGRCAVPDVMRKTVRAAKRELARTNCRLGKIRLGYSNRVKTGRVLSERPRAGTVLPRGGKVDVVVSRGRKR